MGAEDVFGFTLGWSVFSSSFISPSDGKQHTGGASLCEATAFIHWQNALLLLLTTCCSVSFFPPPLLLLSSIKSRVAINSGYYHFVHIAIRRCSSQAMLFMPCRSSVDSVAAAKSNEGIYVWNCIFTVCNTTTATAKKDRKIAMDVPMILRRVYTIIYPIIIIILINSNIINNIVIHEHLMIFASEWVVYEFSVLAKQNLNWGHPSNVTHPLPPLPPTATLWKNNFI